MQIDASALYLIAARSTPEPVKRELVERAQRGEPIEVLNGKSSTGNRIRACEEVGALVRIRTITVSNQEQPHGARAAEARLMFVLSANLYRRHLTTEDRLALGSKFCGSWKRRLRIGKNGSPNLLAQN